MLEQWKTIISEPKMWGMVQELWLKVRNYVDYLFVVEWFPQQVQEFALHEESLSTIKPKQLQL